MSAANDGLTSSSFDLAVRTTSLAPVALTGAFLYGREGRSTRVVRPAPSVPLSRLNVDPYARAIVGPLQWSSAHYGYAIGSSDEYDAPIGKALKNDTDPVKRKIGLVPQDLALFDELTAIENLQLFGGLYDLSGAALAEDGHAAASPWHRESPTR